MIKSILNLQGAVVLKKENQKIIRGGAFGCQNETRKCTDNSDCCSGICGVEKYINGRLVILSVCAA